MPFSDLAVLAFAVQPALPAELCAMTRVNDVSEAEL